MASAAKQSFSRKTGLPRRWFDVLRTNLSNKIAKGFPPDGYYDSSPPDLS